MISKDPQSDSSAAEQQTSQIDADDLIARLDRLRETHSDLPIDDNSVIGSAGGRNDLWIGDLTGKTLGQYQIQRVVGRGTFGVVYQAIDLVLDRAVAIKTPRLEFLVDDDKLRRFEMEARAAAMLDHPAIVPVLEASFTNTIPFIATRYMEGPNLAQWLIERNDEKPDQPLDDKDIAAWMAVLADGVQHAHSHGVTHRDVKPSNVLMTLNRTDDCDAYQLASYDPHLTDFGLARLASGTLHDTAASVIMGTPLYMAPEQVNSDDDAIGPATDIYALGCILYELLTGQPPHVADSYAAVLDRLQSVAPRPPREIRPEIDRDLETICLKCLEKRSGDRYASAKDLADDLSRFQQSHPIRAKRAGLWQRVCRWAGHPARVAEAMLATILFSVMRGVTAVLGLVLLNSLNEAPPTSEEVTEATLAHAFFTFPMECCFIWAAVRQRANRLPSVFSWIAFSASLAMCVFTMYSAIGLLPSVQWYERHPGARTVAYSFVSLSFACQALCWLVTQSGQVASNSLAKSRSVVRNSLLAVAIVLIVLGFFIDQDSFRLTRTSHDVPTQSMLFDGEDDYAEILDVGFRPGRPVTIEAWLLPMDTRKSIAVSYQPLSIGTTAAMDGLRIQIDIPLGNDGTYMLDSRTVVPINQWVHVAVTYDTQNVRLFINGRESGYDVSTYWYDETTDEDYTETALRLPRPFHLIDVWPGAKVALGANNPGQFPFHGRIADVRLSRSVFYEGTFTPLPRLAVAADTQLLLHLSDDESEIRDETDQYTLSVTRGDVQLP
ncbi:protein kinase domain-containing protein [Stieleria varia]|uniref:Serine/threonine-protein kinase PrkC n=1 Tax=Stieleria varia TaxID=2528005 RepID=A0A5C6AW76_9BACT|nr:protein kinase [Stieleria varia]TWU04275.1 Serine/threonine-protein kinase PrkC [Stieleria varia]